MKEYGKQLLEVIAAKGCSISKDHGVFKIFPHTASGFDLVYVK